MEKIGNKVVNENKWSMGKYLRNLKGFSYNSNSESKYLEISLSKEKQELLNYLIGNGFKFSKLALGEFYLKNGLAYQGVLAKDRILANECVFRMQKHLCLNTRAAYLSEIKQIFDENKAEFIYEDENEIIDDYILLFYILYEFQKGEKSKWYYFIASLPRDQGFLALWNDEDLDFLEEEPLKKKAKKQYNEFLEEYCALSRISKKYPQFFQPSTFSLENFTWIYSILTNRSFFGNFKYVTLIPFVDMLNHENHGVYYTQQSKTEENEDDKLKNAIELKEISEEFYEKCSTETESWGEEDPDDFLEEEAAEFVEPAVDLEQKKQGFLSENPIIHKLFSYFQEKLSFSDISSLIFLNKLVVFTQKINVLSHYYDEDEFMLWIEIYKRNVYLYYEELKNTDYCNNFFPSTVPSVTEIEKNQKKAKDPFEKSWEDEDYDEFIFSTKENQNFLANTQVYLNYGGYSNKKLLKIYGMSLEYNKSGKLFLNFNHFEDICDELKRFLVDTKGLKHRFFQQFKLKYTKFNIDLIIFFKMMAFEFEKDAVESIYCCKNLDFEIRSIKSIIEFLQNFKISKNSLEENEKLLYDKSLSYNKYFAVVYKLEKQRILRLNLTLYEIALHILQKISKGMEKLEAFNERIESLEKGEEEFQRHRFLLRSYLKTYLKN